MEGFEMRLSGKGFSSMKRLEQIKGEFRNALKALEEALSTARSDLEVDGAIQRFEFTYELFWKLLRAFLRQEGIAVDTPRECFKEAYRLALLKDEETALRMLEDRNLTVHLYDRKTLRSVFERIKSLYGPLFNEVLERIEFK
jgi:nucleotidyltransferase substrate binding protein (TIGR01987 family)